jgi:hypothetical protein
MLHKNLSDLLGRLGFAKDGQAWLAPAAHTASVYLTRGDESLILDGVVRIEAGDDTAIITTARKEKYGVELGEVRAIRVVPDKAR